ncbi:hypothetical protein C2845_PM05G01240 [Panicum miliaceum]|uniref:Reverse transcriptase zinc-binding domain-containing protein n=1 Tax=Panicum miliaceum TaxID=4540 RepID=A0A3L6T323_PANMI|nr:hypothetical protein C2845_PM05G01240 [Panicum miliaceum]
MGVGQLVYGVVFVAVAGAFFLALHLYLAPLHLLHHQLAARSASEIDGKCVQELAPYLFNVVGSRIVAKTIVEHELLNDGWVRDITGSLTVQVILDFLLIWDARRNIALQPDVHDKFLWKWTTLTDRCFTTSSTYKAFFIGQAEILGARVLKKAHAPGKCKIFTWLTLHDRRCWTAERRRRHNLQATDTCILCAQESESIAHLLVGCSFSREVWYRVLFRLRWRVLTLSNRYFDLGDWWMASRKKLQKADRKQVL